MSFEEDVLRKKREELEKERIKKENEERKQREAFEKYKIAEDYSTIRAMYEDAFRNSVGKKTMPKIITEKMIDLKNAAIRTAEGIKGQILEIRWKKLIKMIVLVGLSVRGGIEVVEDVAGLFADPTAYISEAKEDLEAATVYKRVAYDSNGTEVAHTENDFYYKIDELAKDIRDETSYDNGIINVKAAAKRIVALYKAMLFKNEETARENIKSVIIKVFLGHGNFKTLDEVAKAVGFENEQDLIDAVEKVLRAESDAEKLKAGRGK